MKRIIFLSTILLTSLLTFGQNQDVNPYGGIYYNDQSNVRNYGRFVLPRSETSNLDTLTNIVKGTLVFDSLENRVEYADTSGAWIGISAGNTLDQAYDQGGKGFGREIVADSGAVYISGEDGFIVTGTYGSGDGIGALGGGAKMYFNPNKSAFRAGATTLDEWDESETGDFSAALGFDTKANGDFSFSVGNTSEALAENSIALSSGVASALSSFAFLGQANGEYSISAGLGNTSESYSESVIGLYDTDYSPNSTSSWFWSDRIFSIGNGTSNGSRSNALTILKNGNSGFGTDTPDTTVHIVGQMRYVDGNEGDYKYLTSDANGNASWGPDGCFTGWESIQDDTHTTTVLADDTVTIPIFRDVVVNSQLPCGIDSLWNMADSTVIGREGDALCVSLDFTIVQTTNNATEFKWWFNIGGSIGILYPTTYDQNKGIGVEKEYNKTTTVYTLDTWEANGGKIQFTTDQDMEVSNVRINIFRIHKAR